MADGGESVVPVLGDQRAVPVRVEHGREQIADGLLIVHH